MLRKSLLPLIATLIGVFPAMAWDHMYIIGPGTVMSSPGNEWNLDHAIEMKETYQGSNVYRTVCYLKNHDGVSFRFQPEKAYTSDKDYCGASSNGQPLSNDAWTSIKRETGNCFSVPTPGIYAVEANFNTNQVKITQTSSIYVVGSLVNHPWTVDKYAPLTNTATEPSLYTGNIDITTNAGSTTGDFKIDMDPDNHDNDGWEDSRFWLLKDSKHYFKNTFEGDDKWTVGYPDQDTHAEQDLVPGMYRVAVNTATKMLSFTRLPKTVTLAGPAVLQDWTTAGNLTLSSDGQGQFVKKHVFFRSNDIFKPVVDGKYYGNHQWSNTQVPDNSNVYLKNVDTGADLSVASTGFRDVYIRPSDGNDGTLDIYITGPQDVWFDGIGTLTYDASSTSYKNDNFKWLDAGASSKAIIGGDNMQTLSATGAGWYTCSITFNGSQPRYNLVRNIPVLTGNATDSKSFSDNDVCGESFVRHSVYLEGGRTLGATIGSKNSPDIRVGKSGYYTVKVNLDQNGQPKVSITGPIDVHMPLTEEDFKDGRKHYFLVGQRMGAWRLQPEWEFQYAGGNTYSISPRLLYNGYVMVGVVDNYADYIAQCYKGYSDTNTGANIVFNPKTSANGSFALAYLPAAGRNGCSDGKYTSTRYDEIERTSPAAQHGGWDALAKRAINIYSADGFGDQQHLQSHPSRVNSIRLNVDSDGTPTWLEFNDVTTDKMEVARLRTFSLVGGGIRNQKITYDDNGVTSPLNRQAGYDGNAWSEAWIQYDAKGKPYVDAHGEYMYQTCFTKDWLRAHPSFFNFGDDFEYTSNNITFIYNENATHPDQFGGNRQIIDADGNPTGKTERLYTYFDNPDNIGLGNNIACDNNLDDVMYVDGSRRVCYVVEDMWMEGMFKVWSGWGGSATNYEYEQNETNYTRWYRANGGHGAWRDDRAVFYRYLTETAFTIFEDIDAANFGIGYGLPGSEKVEADGSIKAAYKEHPERRFFKKVVVWYCIENGFARKGKDNTSFLIFLQERGGPNITIAKKDEDDNHIQYSFHIPLVNGMESEADTKEFGLINRYHIERIPIYDDGSEGEPVLVKDVDMSDNPQLREDFVYTDIDDPTALAPGRYRYKITTYRTQGGGIGLSAKSNIVRINANSTVTGVDEVVAGDGGNEDFSLNISPNPVTDILTIHASTDLGHVEIYSINGSMVRTARFASDSGSIDVSSLTPGIYIVRALNCSKRIIKR